MSWWDKFARNEDVLAMEPGAPDEKWQEITDTQVGLLESILKFRRYVTFEAIDFGGGIGRLTVPLAESHPEGQFTVVDTSPVMLENVPHRDNIHLAHKLDDLSDSQYQLAFSVLVFQHNYPGDVQDYVTKMCNKLLSGGVFACQIVEADEYREEGPRSHFYTEDQIDQWCSDAGVDIHSTSNHGYDSWLWLEGKKR